MARPPIPVPTAAPIPTPVPSVPAQTGKVQPRVTPAAPRAKSGDAELDELRDQLDVIEREKLKASPIKQEAHNAEKELLRGQIRALGHEPCK